MSANAADHWDAVYDRAAEDSVSWYQEVPIRSLAALDELGIDPRRSVVDVGAGASRLVDELVRRGFADVTVLDVSAAGLAQARKRLGEAGTEVSWVVGDVLTWAPMKNFDVWHDRAVFHFLTDPNDVQRYFQVLDRSLGSEGLVLIGTFATDGPTHCSGLPVSRYSPGALSDAFGEGYEHLVSWREEHRSPSNVVQPFTWVAMRRCERVGRSSQNSA
jgi:SAM-dependent methyltransferase